MLALAGSCLFNFMFRLEKFCPPHDFAGVRPATSRSGHRDGDLNDECSKDSKRAEIFLQIRPVPTSTALCGEPRRLCSPCCPSSTVVAFLSVAALNPVRRD